MKELRISSGGQLSLPAEVRRRWATDRLVIEDLGDRVVLRPIPSDPAEAAIGSLRRGRSSTNKAKARLRREEQAAERRKFRA
jgi:bifunctional DNA-binding transcriptional regulator/antitoxin component of YhaV-PrlF toxin-antitoxin module